jgi:hypothetical protein
MTGKLNRISHHGCACEERYSSVLIAALCGCAEFAIRIFVSSRHNLCAQIYIWEAFRAIMPVPTRFVRDITQEFASRIGLY